MTPQSFRVRGTVFLVVVSALAGSSTVAASDEEACQSCGRCVQAFLTTLEDHGWLGMAVHLHHAADGDRIEVQFVDEAGPAANAGLRRADRITRIEELNTETASADDVVQRLYRIHPGERVVFGIRRGDRDFEVEMQAEPMSMRAKAEALGTFLLRRLRQTGVEPPEPEDHSSAHTEHDRSSSGRVEPAADTPPPPDPRRLCASDAASYPPI